MNNKKFLFISLTLLFLGLILSVGLYEKTNPLAGIKLEVGKNRISEKTEEFLRDRNIYAIDDEFIINFRENTKLLDNLQLKHGIEKAGEICRENLPIFYWKIFYRPYEPGMPKQSIEISYDTKGRLLNFYRTLTDSVEAENLSFDEIKEEADTLISRSVFSGAVFSRVKINNADSYSANGGTYRKDVVEKDEIEIEYLYKNEFLNNDVKIIVVFKKGNLELFESDLPIGNALKSDTEMMKINIIVRVLIVFVTIIIGLVTLFKRVRSGEIGFIHALYVGAFVALMSSFILWGANGNTDFMFKIINAVLSAILVGGAMFVTWSITETLIREKWTDKLSSFDLMVNGHFTHSLLGKNILLGISAGFFFTGIQALVSYVMLMFGNFSMTNNLFDLTYFSSDFPLLKLTSSSLLLSAGLAVPFVGLIPSLLAKKINSEVGIIVVSACIFGAFRFGVEANVITSIIMFVVVSLLFLFLFLKSDLMTIVIALFVNLMLYNVVAFYNMGSFGFLNGGLIFAFVTFLFLVFSITTLFSKDKIKNPLIFAPHYARSISERERLIEEINSARDVQNSFLPKKMPEFDGLDISAICKPAIEVGGDYYDFHEISESEFSFVIGDVSGKGTKAAFIMTIVKGFIKTLFKVYKEPKEILINLNKLFIENVPKGNFVTVALGKINVVEKTLTFCSAGHNPIILRKQNGEIIELNPNGMAIGLTRESIFESTLQEQKINYEPGDLLVTYTDGFTETKNRKKEEFGVEKFTHIVQIFAGCNSEELLNLLIKHTNRFRGYAKQHDDMTIIIINFDH